MFTVVGIEKVGGEYEGRSWSGRRFHVTHEKRGCDGLAVDGVYCPDSIPDSAVVKVGDTVDFMYNKYGRVACIIIM